MDLTRRLKSKMWEENVLINFVEGDISTNIHICKYILHEKDLARYDVME